jgi:hypothetical protein
MRACPHKLAQECNLSPHKIEAAIKEMCDHGWGKHLSKRMLKIFEAQALQHCETDSEDENIDEEYAQIQANRILEGIDHSPPKEDYHTPGNIPSPAPDNDEVNPLNTST